MPSAANVIELFSGCGGTSCGLLAAGYQVRLGVDNNSAAIDTFNYAHSHVGARGIVSDVRQLGAEELRQHAGIGRRKLDLLTGGPPCQPFSIVGKRRGLNDERGDLVLEYVRLLEELAPAAFIFENVANFATFDNGRVADRVVSGMERAGYAVTSGVLDVSEYGVPQMRKRFIALGIRGKKGVPLPAPTHGSLPLLKLKPVRTARDAIGDLPDVDTEEALLFANHEGTTHSPAMLKVFRTLRPGERDPKSHHDRLDPDRPAYTIRAGNGNFSPLRPVHYKFPRVISVRESARIQGFPDHFAWPDDMSRLQQYRQVGNAVPPLLAKVLGQHLARSVGFAVDPDQYGQPSSRTDRRSTLSLEERIAKRECYIRGASLGSIA